MTVVHPQWAWEYTDREGRVLDRPVSPVFTARFDAEEWLGSQWRPLRDQGVVGAVLRHDGRTVPPAYDLAAVPEQMTAPRA